MTAKKYPKEFYPIECNRFEEFQKRVAKGQATTIWPRSTEGFLAFLSFIGTAPKDMIKPTVGRFDHSKGYEPGNCKWQSHSDNAKEAATRTWRDRRGEMLKVRITNRGKSHSKEHSEKIKQALLGKRHSEKRILNMKIGVFSKTTLEERRTRSLLAVDAKKRKRSNV